MSPYVPFIFNFVKSEGTLPLLDKLPLATSQPSDIFSPKLLDCLSIWSPKVREKNKLNKNCIQSSYDHFFFSFLEQQEDGGGGDNSPSH